MLALRIPAHPHAMRMGTTREEDSALSADTINHKGTCATCSAWAPSSQTQRWPTGPRTRWLQAFAAATKPEGFLKIDRGTPQLMPLIYSPAT